MKRVWLVLATLLILSGCIQKEESKKKDSQKSMKCGAGKCGANLFDGNTALIKKKKNILSQMQEKDSRKPCVLQAETTKALYDCVRDPSTGKLTIMDPHQQTSKKCGAKKCGGKM